MRRRVPILWSQLALLIFWASANASPLFEDDALLEIELRGPLGETLRDTGARSERPFKLTVDGEELDVMVRVRGKSRVETCRFPPLRLDFADPAGTVFAGQDKLKLVTHCNKASSFELNVLEEYLAYRLLALFAPAAVQVRLLHIRYVDADKPGNEPIERFAFVLEPQEDLAARIGGQLVDLEGVALSRLERTQISSVFVAQYLIGNADYSLVKATGADTCCHNGILVEVDGKLHYVTYDLDRASLVGASYAKPQAAYGRRARARRYVGYCMDDLDLESTIARVRDAREAVFAEISAVEALSGRDLKKAKSFLEGFFREAEEPGKLAARFEKMCID